MRVLGIKNRIGVFVILGLLFVISPITGAILSFLALFYFSNNKGLTRICFFYIALFLAIINTLKVPENDLKMYLWQYNLVETNTFFDYIFLFKKEQFFYFFNYVTYKLTSGSFIWYVAIFTVISYYLIFTSIWKVHKSLKGSVYSFLLCIGISVLFPMLFSLSAHLMRQFLASSLIMYVLVSKIFYKENKYLYYILAVLTHSTSLIFLMIFLPINKKVKLLRIFVISILFLAIVFSLFYYAETLHSIFDSVPVVSYVLERLSNPDGIFKTDNLGLVNYALQLFVVVLFYLQSISDNFKNIVYERYKLFFISLLLFLFIISNYYNTEIALRFSFYIYFLFPLSFYFYGELFSSRFSKAINQISFVPIILVFLLWFIVKLKNGSWTYNNLDTLLFSFL
ncbi:EpsG family protein [Gelatiniphilus marinus]|uniref:EpsG family protein n=1 Tax=Gelatiniphilus marinus TaxID=1759464 RepID=A0ABW5JV93_9FLAO